MLERHGSNQRMSELFFQVFKQFGKISGVSIVTDSRRRHRAVQQRFSLHDGKRSILSAALFASAARPSIFADGSGFLGPHHPEKFTVENGERIKRTDKEETMTLFLPTSSYLPSAHRARTIPSLSSHRENNAACSYDGRRIFPSRVDSLNQ